VALSGEGITGVNGTNSSPCARSRNGPDVALSRNRPLQARLRAATLGENPGWVTVFVPYGTSTNTAKGQIEVRFTDSAKDLAVVKNVTLQKSNESRVEIESRGPERRRSATRFAHIAILYLLSSILCFSQIRSFSTGRGQHPSEQGTIEMWFRFEEERAAGENERSIISLSSSSTSRARNSTASVSHTRRSGAQTTSTSFSRRLR